MTIALRKVALCLYSLNETDRNWLINKLPENTVSGIKYLLEELKITGIPSNENWVAQLFSYTSTHQETRSKEQLIINRINNSDIGKIFNLLKDEPVHVIAIIMSHESWIWRKKVIRKFSKRIRSEIEQKINDINGKITEKIKQEYISALDRKL